MTDYIYFARSFTEAFDFLRELQAERSDISSFGEPIPHYLLDQIHRHIDLIDILTQAGEEMYNKTPKELYFDGWNFQIAERDEFQYSS